MFLIDEQGAINLDQTPFHFILWIFPKHPAPKGCLKHVETQRNRMVPINCRISSSIGIFPWTSTPHWLPMRARHGCVLPQRSSWTASRFHPWYPRWSWRCPLFPDGPDGMAIFCGGQPRLGELLAYVGLIFWGYRTVLSIIIIL